MNKYFIKSTISAIAVVSAIDSKNHEFNILKFSYALLLWYNNLTNPFSSPFFWSFILTLPFSVGTSSTVAVVVSVVVFSFWFIFFLVSLIEISTYNSSYVFTLPVSVPFFVNFLYKSEPLGLFCIQDFTTVFTSPNVVVLPSSSLTPLIWALILFAYLTIIAFSFEKTSSTLSFELCIKIIFIIFVCTSFIWRNLYSSVFLYESFVSPFQ